MSASSRLVLFNTNKAKHPQIEFQNHLYYWNKTYKSNGNERYDCSLKKRGCQGSITITPGKTNEALMRLHKRIRDDEYNILL